ncbi:hypothetical protein Tco_0837487 [Tanacetum coccineum]
MKTPMASDTKLTKDEECESVDSTKYRGMIGSLLYLTASRPDIMLVSILWPHPEAPKTSHLEAVKRIFLLPIQIEHASSAVAPSLQRKTRADRGKKRPREPNASSSSSTLNHPSLSHPLNDSTHENDDESSHSNPSSPPQNTSSSSNNVSRVPQNPPS